MNLKFLYNYIFFIILGYNFVNRKEWFGRAREGGEESILGATYEEKRNDTDARFHMEELDLGESIYSRLNINIPDLESSNIF